MSDGACGVREGCAVLSGSPADAPSPPFCITGSVCGV